MDPLREPLAASVVASLYPGVFAPTPVTHDPDDTTAAATARRMQMIVRMESPMLPSPAL